MPRTDSSAIARIDYDAFARKLDVTFHTRRHYTYFEVPAEVYYQFARASSYGAFFNAMIRDKYRFLERER